MPRFAPFLAALRDPARWRRWLIEALILIAIVGAVTVWQNHGLPEGAAPQLVGLRTDGATEDLGKKVSAGGTATLVVFWATWCPFCRAEEDNIVAVAADWPVVSVALQSGDPHAVAQYLKERGVDLPAVVDDDGFIAAAWRVRGTPTHFILDPAGRIRFRVVGYATEWGLRFRLWWASRFPADNARENQGEY
ncbi:MAG: protein disulfide oxidoreductase [Pseudomonadota bacterium]